MEEKEALVVCSDKSLGIGITIWDLESRDHLLHIPTCASPPHGLICLKDQFLVASQVQKPGSVGGGVIFTWPLNKHQATLRSYVMEVIEPLACTKDGIFLAGGSTSGNIYVWEAQSGRLLKKWCAHKKSIKCMAFSQDASILISGSVDGRVVVWSMISLLDDSSTAQLQTIFSCSMEHKAAITSLLSTSFKSFPTFISSSLDGTYKVWDMVRGKLLKAQDIRLPITVAVMDTYESMIFCGCANGKIIGKDLDIGLLEDPCSNPAGEKVVLNGHLKSVTALTFSKYGLISASEDRTICVWDITGCAVIHKFNHLKGPITNLVVVPKLSLLQLKNHQKISNRVSLLEKCLRPSNQAEGTRVLLPSQCDEEGKHFGSGYRTATLLNQQIVDLQRERTSMGLQMKIETNTRNQMWATSMAKHTMKMNKHLQLSFLDMLQSRLVQNSDAESPTTEKEKVDDQSLP